MSAVEDGGGNFSKPANEIYAGIFKVEGGYLYIHPSPLAGVFAIHGLKCRRQLVDASLCLAHAAKFTFYEMGFNHLQFVHIPLR